MIQESYSRFYDTTYLEQIAINAFYGWGYNFYRQENQLRQDDLRVRARASFLLNSAKSIIDKVSSDYRRKHLKPPTKDQPYDGEALENAEMLSRLSRSISQLEGRVRALPAPGTDRMTQRFRQEAQTLNELIKYDQQMVGQLVVLLTGIEEHKDVDWLLENEGGISAGLDAISTTITARQSFLM